MNWKKTAIAAALALGVVGVAAYAQPTMQLVHGYEGMMGGYGMMHGDGMGPGMMYGEGRGGYGHGPMHGYGMGPGMMHGQGMGPGMMGGPGLGMLYRLDLTDTQRDQLGKIENDLRKKNWDLMGKMQDEMVKLRDGWSAKKTDRSAILAANKKMFELRQQMLENRLDAQDKAEALLTPQQKQQYEKFTLSWFEESRVR